MLLAQTNKHTIKQADKTIKNKNLRKYSKKNITGWQNSRRNSLLSTKLIAPMTTL